MCIQVTFMSAHPMWLEACAYYLESLARPFKVTQILSEGDLSADLTEAIDESPQVVVASLDFASGSFEIVPALRTYGYPGRILALCSYHAMPLMEELAAADVESVVSSWSSLEELASALYALVDGCPEPLLQQYVQATRVYHRKWVQALLSEREQEILLLVAGGLTDKQIAARLSLSSRTVSTYLSAVYTKLGVRGRTAAVAAILSGGLLDPDSSQP